MDEVEGFFTAKRGRHRWVVMSSWKGYPVGGRIFTTQEAATAWMKYLIENTKQADSTAKRWLTHGGGEL